MQRSLTALVLAALIWPVSLEAQAAEDALAPAPETEAACAVAGGRWAIGGLAGRPLCFLPTPDAGAACTTAADCVGFCLADSGTCSAETPQFGCFAIRDLDGAEVTLCID